MSAKPKPRTIVILALPGVQLLDVAGSLDVFAEANLQAGHEAYALLVAAAEPGPIRSSSGVRLMPDRIIDRSFEDNIDTLLIAGCPNAADLPANGMVIDWLRRRVSRTRRFGSVCSGAFFLAAAGLLDGRRVTTHWAVADRLAEKFPAVSVDKDAIYVTDGKLRTAAGVTAGLDLALALVEEDLGRETAMKVASQLVMFFKRPGGQMQFTRKGEAVPPAAPRCRSCSAGSPPIRDWTTASQAWRSAWTSARVTLRGCFAPKSELRLQPGSKKPASMRPAACWSSETRLPSKWPPIAALRTRTRCAERSPAMSA